MSKFLATAAEVVGAVALVASGVGAAAGAGLIAASATTATIATVATVATFATAVLGAAAALTAPKASAGGSPEAWQADPDAGIDIVLGDAFNAGHIIYRHAYGSTNQYETIVTNWSLGPVHSIDQLYVEQIPRSVAGGVVNTDDFDHGVMHEARQLGACPEPGVLNCGPQMPYGWTAQHKLSGLAATMTTFIFDSAGKATFEAIPQCGWRGKGKLGYDPRQDSTYPGGSGPQRAGDETTWAWSNNPYVLALTWCIGWRQNGKLVAGAGLPLAGLIVPMFVEGANVADANGWTCGGVKSTLDDPWDVLKDILQAGGGEPLRLGALLGCRINTPRVSLTLIDRNALAQGDISIAAMQSRRDRINGISPRCMTEQVITVDTSSGSLQTTTNWADMAFPPVVVPAYVAADGRERRAPVEYPLVQCFNGQQGTQLAQLARYDIENGREFGPIQLPLKIRWMGYKPGDVVTVTIPEAGLVGQPVMILTRALEPSTGVVTITARSETAGKHAFALGQATTPPTAPSLPFNNWSSPLSRGAFSFAAQSVAYPLTSDDASVSVAAYNGTLDNGAAFAVAAGSVGGLTAGTAYGIFVVRATGALSAVVAPALDAMADAGNVFVGWQSTSSGGAYPAAAAVPSGYGGTGGSAYEQQPLLIEKFDGGTP